MPDNDVTLYSLLFNRSPATGAAVLLEGLKQQSPGALAAWQEIQRKQITAAIEDQVAGGFDIKIGSILAQGWSDLSNVREAIDPAGTPPDISRSVTLENQEFEWTNRPKLVISIDGVKPIEVEFELLLTLDIGVATLVIRDARIYEIALGDYRGEAKMVCDGHDVYRCPLTQGRLPGHLRFPEGIPLRRVRHDGTTGRSA
jgi:hypothetical protein